MQNLCRKSLLYCPIKVDIVRMPTCSRYMCFYKCRATHFHRPGTEYVHVANAMTIARLYRAGMRW
jgi:hypothetical protein